MIDIPRLVIGGTHSGVGKTGGFMYLAESIVGTDGREYPMIGLFPTRERMQERIAALAYVEAEAIGDGPWLRPGEHLRGHEFRYSNVDGMPPSIARRFRLRHNGAGEDGGFAVGSVLAGYAHLHFRSFPTFAARFVAACENYRTRVPEDLNV